MLALAVPAHAARPPVAGRAVASYVAMERYLFDTKTRAYPNQQAWPISQAVAATIAVARIPGARTDAAAHAESGFKELATLRAGGLYEASTGASIYYDDNEWIAQDLLDWNVYRASRAAVAQAETIFAGVVHAWDSDSTTPCAGGVYWTTATDVRDRNAVSTANGALVGLRLYALTRRPVFLYWSRRMLDWMNTCLLAPNGLYWDHVAADGTVDQHEWSYNQGSPIAAYVLLYETTGDRSALTRAEQLADGTLATFSGTWLTEPPQFAAIFFQHVLELAAIDGRARYVAAAQAYAAAAWSTLRDPQTGLFSGGLLGQAAFVQLYAHLALTESGAAARRSPPPATAPTPRGSGGADEDRGRARPSPRTRPAQAARNGRSSRTSR